MTYGRIEIKTGVMLGKPVIAGTRVTVEQILRECALGLSAAEIADQYVGVEPADIAAALSFAADYLRHETSFAAE